MNHIFIRFSRICVTNKSTERKQIFEMDLEYKNDQLALDFEYNEGMLTLFLMPLAGLYFCVGLDFVTPSM
jgi:hypothetical protein